MQGMIAQTKTTEQETKTNQAKATKRRYIIQVVLNALAIALVLVVLPQVDYRQR